MLIDEQMEGHDLCTGLLYLVIHTAYLHVCHFHRHGLLYMTFIFPT